MSPKHIRPSRSSAIAVPCPGIIGREAWITYAVYRKMQAPEVLTVVSYGVDPKSKKVLDSFFGYVGVDPSTNQFTGLFFSNEGWVSSALVVPAGRGLVYQVDTILSNHVHTAATLFEEWESDTVTTMTWKNILQNGTFLAQGKPARFVKMSESMRELRESGAIVFPTDNEPISALAPLKRLAGRWEGKDASGSGEVIEHSLTSPTPANCGTPAVVRGRAVQTCVPRAAME